MKEAIIKKFGADLAQISGEELAAYVQNLAFEQSLKALRGLSEDAKSAKSAELILSFAAELNEIGALKDASSEALSKGEKRHWATRMSRGFTSSSTTTMIYAKRSLVSKRRLKP